MIRTSCRKDLECKINDKVMPSHRNKNPNIVSAKVNFRFIYIVHSGMCHTKKDTHVSSCLKKVHTGQQK
jgi:hypothetical protein